MELKLYYIRRNNTENPQQTRIRFTGNNYPCCYPLFGKYGDYCVLSCFMKIECHFSSTFHFERRPVEHVLIPRGQYKPEPEYKGDIEAF